MVRVVGIDPGTMSMDVCGLQDGEVYFERVVPTSEVAERPWMLIEAVEEAMPVDLIAGPSGYGVELTYLKDIPKEMLEDWYYQYILLTQKVRIEEAVKKKVFGALVYFAMTKSALEMKTRGWPVCYIPGVVELPTVPRHRKVNKLDMGTADKMCVAVLGIREHAERYGVPYSKVSFIHVEMGFGYNAVLGVNEGRIVDGIGGTTICGPGFLTLGSMDAELVQLGGTWEKADVFTGGCASICGKSNPEEMVGNVGSEEMCSIAWDAMIESVVRSVAAVKVSVPEPSEVLLSGRLARIEEVEGELVRRIKDVPVRKVEGLRGVKSVKETAEGYAIVADGLAGGSYRELVEWMKIREAKGTAMDHLFHPRIDRIKEELVPFRFNRR